MEVEVPRQGVAPDPSVRRTAPGFVKLNRGFRSAGCSLATFVRDSGAQSLHGSNFVCSCLRKESFVSVVGQVVESICETLPRLFEKLRCVHYHKKL